MDKKPIPIQQQKDRESKIYLQKADIKTKELKELTGTPKIDLLSRKVASLVTKRELQTLGIQTSDPSPKKQTFELPKPANPKATKKTQKFSDPLISPSDKFEEPEPNPGPQFSEIKENALIHRQNEEFKGIPLETKCEVGEINCETKEFDKKNLMVSEENAQNLPVEPQKENPKTVMPKASDDESKDDILNAKDPESNHDNQLLVSEKRISNLHLPSSIDHIPQRSSITDKKNFELFEICSPLLKGRTEATTVTSRTPDIIRRQSLKQQESAFKASLLHCSQTQIGKYTPRCHINLNSGLSSPIFLSFRVPNDSIMKSEDGFASAESLRHVLLRNFLQENPVSQDFYYKSLEWAQKKEEKVKQKRSEAKEMEIEECTFDPYFERHEKKRIEDEQLDYKARVRPDLLQSVSESFEISARPSTVQYFSLSPVDNQVKYLQGFNIEKLLMNGKQMVHYPSVNLLK